MPSAWGENGKQEWGTLNSPCYQLLSRMALARALTWGTTKMSEKMMAASRGNRLSGYTEEEAMLVSATPFPWRTWSST